MMLYNPFSLRKFLFTTFLLLGVFTFLPIVLSQSFVYDSSVKLSDRVKINYTSDMVLKVDGLYSKGILYESKPDVWISSKVNGVYHVDSLSVEDRDVTLEFYYDVQPDFIDHYSHKGDFVRRYYPTNWVWLDNCVGLGEDAVCDGGYVILRATIDYGLGSNTFPIGVTGPTWASNSESYGVFANSDYVVVDGGLFNFGSTQDFSVSVWVKFNAGSLTNTDKIVVSDDSSQRWLLVMYDDDLDWRTDGSTGDVTCHWDNTNLDTVSWWHIVGTSDRDGNNTLYVNGVMVETLNASGVGNISNSVNVGIGAQHDGTEAFDGWIDDVRIYNKSLSLSDVLIINSSGRVSNSSLPDANLIFWADFNDYSVEDKSVNNNHGNFSNVSYAGSKVNRSLVEDLDYDLQEANPVIRLMKSEFYWTDLYLDWDCFYEAYSPKADYEEGVVLGGSDDLQKLPKIKDFIGPLSVSNPSGLVSNVTDTVSDVAGNVVVTVINETSDMKEDLKDVTSVERFFDFIENHFFGVLVLFFVFIFMVALVIGRRRT